MKPTTPHDPLDDLIAAALHGDLTPDERALFESRLSAAPAAQAAYQEAQAMHNLLEQTHRTAQPDPDFEQRMVSAVRRKLAHPPQRETAWESLLFFWKGLRWTLNSRWKYAIGGGGSAMLLALAMAYYHDIGVLRALGNNGIANPAPVEESTRTYLPPQLDADTLPPSAMPKSKDRDDLKKIIRDQGIDNVETEKRGVTMSGYVDSDASKAAHVADTPAAPVSPTVITQSGEHSVTEGVTTFTVPTATKALPATQPPAAPEAMAASSTPPAMVATTDNLKEADDGMTPDSTFKTRTIDKKVTVHDGQVATSGGIIASNTTSATDQSSDSRKLIRNAQLDLEVKSFQAAFDQVTALTKAAGGYVDTSNSQKGGNGKLQGTVVVKVLPQNLDGFLLKLRDLGEVKNQSVSTDDVTKDYFDTQARLVNSQKMEVQLQDLLKRENGKVSDLLAVERELGRVRGEIEQMQGQLKLYDFQVQYATVTMQLAEKDLQQAAAYLLKEQDNFSLFATDVEGTFQKARATADSFKAQVLAADLQHNSGSDVSAQLDVMVAPDQIEPFLAQVRSLGRVANFTRQTQRIAKDGGDSNQPADETLTEKDKVRVMVSIRSDDESRKQVALTVVAKAVDDALDQAKVAALANAGVEILSSSLNKTPQGESSAQLSVRVPGREYSTLMDAFRALGRASSLSIQRNDNSGPGANGDDAPVIISLSLTDNDAPVQATNLSIIASDVDAQAQQIKKQAAAAGVDVKASSFQRQPDGTEIAQMTLRLPMEKYPAFLETLKQAGKVESLSVQRADRPDPAQTDATAPVEIGLQLHNQRAIVPDNDGLWPTLRRTFGEGMAALFGSVRVIGVLIAFLAPWVFTLILAAWIARRIYVWRKNR